MLNANPNAPLVADPAPLSLTTVGAPPNSVPMRLYGVVVDHLTTRTFVCPRYEVPVIQAAWRGRTVQVTETPDVRHVSTSIQENFQRLINAWGLKFVQQIYPGPERLEMDMQRCAEETAEWLDRNKAKELAQHEAERAAQIAAEAVAKVEADQKAAAEAIAKANAESRAAAEAEAAAKRAQA